MSVNCTELMWAGVDGGHESAPELYLDSLGARSYGQPVMSTAPVQHGFDLSTTEAADMLGLHPTTIRRWAQLGRIPHWLTPGGQIRFRAVDVVAVLDNCHPAA